MSCGGALSPVMMTAGAGMMPGASAVPGIGSSLGVSSALTGAIGNFTSLPITSTFSNIVTTATSVLSGGNLDSLRTLGAGTFPALTNAIPASFTSALSSVAPGGMFNGGLTGLVGTTANQLMGGGDLTRFSQIFTSAEGFASQANQFINSSLNVDSISTTFGQTSGGMDNVITGGFNQVSEAFGTLGEDLGQLGNLIDMTNLQNLGSPAALVKQLADVGGMIPSVSNVLKQAGLDTSEINNIVSGDTGSLTDSANKLLYEGMTNITGTELAQVKNILNVTTPNISNMADLLNPVKILPNSFTTLTMPTPNGLRGIYTNDAGAVNSNLESLLTSSPDTLQSINPDLITRTRNLSGLIGRTNQDLLLTTTTRTINT